MQGRVGLALGLSFLACSSAEHTQGGSARGGRAPAEDASSELFAADRLPRFDIELPAESIASLNAISDSLDPRADEYVHATLRYENEVVANVGLRIKGEASFRTLDQKSAFKIKFDEYVPKQSFHGLRRLTLNNMVEDPSFLAERLAYHVYRTAGLPAPRCNNALVYVNGESYGVYANIEAEDKAFLARWFASDAGNLYEELGQDFVPGAETAFELETNETRNDRTRLIALIAAAQAAEPDDFSQTVGARLNLPQFLRFSAVEAAVNQWDMYAYTLLIPNNFRIYEEPSSGRFVFLPWGMDMAMKPFPYSGRAHIPVFELAREGDIANAKITAGVLFRKCLDSPSCRAAYAAQVSEVADVYENAELSRLAATYYAQIKDYVYADSRKEYSNAAFEKAQRVLLTNIAERPLELREDLAGER